MDSTQNGHRKSWRDLQKQLKKQMSVSSLSMLTQSECHGKQIEKPRLKVCNSLIKSGAKIVIQKGNETDCSRRK